MAETIIMPDNNGSGTNGIPFSFPVNFGGNGWNNNGFGSIADLFGLAIIASIFGWGNGGFGGGAGAGFLSNQLNNDSGRQLIMQAVTSQGEQSRQAIQTLSTMLGQDFNLVNSAVQNLQNSVSSLAAAQGLSIQQLINAIQQGNCQLGQQLSQCCCENRLLTTEQGYQAQIRTIEQTNQLGSQADRNTASVVSAINALHTDMTREFCNVKERELTEKNANLLAQNALLRSQIDNANQTAQFAAMLAPINTKLAEIESKQPNTVPVQYPNITAVNTTPYMNGGYYGFPYGYGNINF